MLPATKLQNTRYFSLYFNRLIGFFSIHLRKSFNQIAVKQACIGYNDGGVIQEDETGIRICRRKKNVYTKKKRSFSVENKTTKIITTKRILCFKIFSLLPQNLVVVKKGHFYSRMWETITDWR